MNKNKYSIIRAESAGVFFGKIKSISKDTPYPSVVMDDCRRIHYWEGAASCSQLAMEGVKNPDNCRFSMATNNHTVYGVIENIECTKSAVDTLQKVPVWKV